MWILCDVFENDLPKLQLGESADIHIDAYPDKVLHGKVSDIGSVLDPAIRTAKVRIEVANVGNPPILRVGLFVNATFEGKQTVVHTVIPATAVLHLHDREWVFVPAGDSSFKRTEVHGGAMHGSKQEILSGLEPGQKVVSNALSLESTVNQ